MKSYTQEVVDKAHHLEDPTDLTPLIAAIKDKKVVMLGESSHGTSEYYRWRKEISLELLRHHDFDFIAIEGDWPPCQKVNSYITGANGRSPMQVLSAFDRWPTWMWANSDVAELIEELKELNETRKEKIGFHGLDVYSLIESVDEVTKILSQIDPVLSEKAKKMYACFEPYRHDEKEYARSLFRVPEGCREEVVSVLEEILAQRIQDPEHESFLFDAIQNARVIKNAENYYRAMVSIDDQSWNVRDRHMMETLEMLMNHYGPDAKGIVWEHNTHIGDYRGTDMVLHGQVNLGGLAREKLGEDNVALVGFGTYSGTVIASHAWDGPTKTLPVPEARPQSIEAVFHTLVPEIGHPDFYLLFDDASKKSSALMEFKGHRAIGVVYHPDSDRRGNYVPTALAKRYDAFVYLDETHALTPFTVGFDPRKLPESYPYGSRV